MRFSEGLAIADPRGGKGVNDKLFSAILTAVPVRLAALPDALLPPDCGHLYR